VSPFNSGALVKTPRGLPTANSAIHSLLYGWILFYIRELGRSALFDPVRHGASVDAGQPRRSRGRHVELSVQRYRPVPNERGALFQVAFVLNFLDPATFEGLQCILQGAVRLVSAHVVKGTQLRGIRATSQTGKGLTTFGRSSGPPLKKSRPCLESLGASPRQLDPPHFREKSFCARVRVYFPLTPLPYGGLSTALPWVLPAPGEGQKNFPGHCSQRLGATGGWCWR
jgi:hypothetical protein